MFAKKSRNSSPDAEHSQPLLQNAAGNNTLFAVDDDDDEDTELTALHSSRSDHSVRFTEHVQVIGPPLRSTLASREAGAYVFNSPFLSFSIFMNIQNMSSIRMSWTKMKTLFLSLHGGI